MAINLGNFGKTGTYEAYVSRMAKNQVDYICSDDKRELKVNNITPMEYITASLGKMNIKVCPEPITFLKEITKYDTSSKRQEAFLEVAKKFENMNINRPENNLWFNKTSNGINIRLGNVGIDTGNQEPATLGDDCVHGVVVGRTGSGKSVLINNIILNLTTEYAPWELELFLVDMKKVELSRYMANAEDGSFLTPHVSACGATSEVRYVVSMIQYLSDCMKARQALFAALGIQKIKDFREKYSKDFGEDFVLPRILLLVDEFQQMFLEASGKERRILDECITAITKLGRATGVHLLFASQEMSGALGSKELANFKLRIALPCDASISEQILGNAAASKINEKGITLVNKKGGSKEEDNIEYRTPFVNDKDEEDGELSEFQRYLTKIHNASRKVVFRKVQKFYQEDTQEKMERIEKIKSSEVIRRQMVDFLNHNPALIDAFVLGSGVLYSNKKNNYESFFIERGKKRNIGILCAKDADIGNTLKTLAENFRFSNVQYKHSVIYESEILRSAYPNLIEDLGELAKEEGYQDFYYGTTKRLDKIISGFDYSLNRKQLWIMFIEKYIELLTKTEKESYIVEECKKVCDEKNFAGQLVDVMKNLPEQVFDTDVDEIIKALMPMLRKIQEEANAAKKAKDAEATGINQEETKSTNKQTSSLEISIKHREMLIKALISILMLFCANSNHKDVTMVTYYGIFMDSIKNGKYTGPVHVVWLIGTDNIDKGEDKLLSKIMETCTNNEEIYILAGANPENLEMSYRCCNYLFLNTDDEKLYTKYKISYTKKSDDNKTMDFKIINYNQECTYKQLSFECMTGNAPKLDFEEIEV